jgi:hypothetical protein
MRRIMLVSMLLIITLISLVPEGVVFALQVPTNLLTNPNFEGDYYAWSGIAEAQVAHGWTPWWRSRLDSDPPAYYYKPEYKQANGYIFPNRVHSGAAAQQWFTFFSTHEAGMYQQVFDVSPGSRYRFTIWAQVWSSSENDPSRSINPAYPNLQVGIDPTGNWNPYGGSVVWSGTYAYYDAWGQLAVEAIARNHVITVFMRSEPNFPVKHNDMYWDDAELVAVGQSAPPIQATATSPAEPTSPPPAVSPTARATCAPVPADWVLYTVQSGDTLWGLATRTGTTMVMIESVNCLPTRTIEVGQQLYLPKLPPTVTSTPRPYTATPRPPATNTPEPTVTSTKGASPTPTKAPDTPTPTEEPETPTPTEEPDTPTPTRVPPTATNTSVPPTNTPEPSDTPVPATATAAATPTQTATPTATSTKAPPTIAPPATSTPGRPAALPTATPSGAAARPCGTIAVSGGIVLIAGIFGLRQRGKSA